MSIDTEALKERTDIVAVIGSYIPLKKRGAEYVGLCPFHSDNNPSFWVNPVKKFGHCFSCGAHKDVIEFVKDFEGIDFKAACEKLGATDDWKPVRPIPRERTEPRPERITSKPPVDAPALSPEKMKLRTIGEPSRVWEYKDEHGDLLGYVARYDTDEGKQIRCWSWGSVGTESAKWAPGHWNKPRPLYGLDRLTARSGARVLVVEGEKAADAAQLLLPEYVVVTWPGGSQSWHAANWLPIKGREVLLWPDNDIPGLECMGKLAAILADPRGLDCKVRIIDPYGMPDGFDAADFQGTVSDLLSWARPRAKDYEHPAATPAPDPEPPQPPQDDAPPVEAYAEEAERSAQPKARKPRQKPRLAAVNGNAALAPEEDAEALPADMSEDMLAEHFVNTHGRNWRFVRQWGSWFEWRGDGWYRDDVGKVDRLAVEITRQALYWPEAGQLTPDGRRKVNSKRTAGNLRDIAQSAPQVAATVDQWDTHQMLLGVPGGVVDLKTGQLAEPRADDYITKRTRISPAEGDAPLWRRFLETVTAGDGELIAFMQRFAGYALTGETREQCLAFLYGTGQNGKGVFITTIANILGDYAMSADADVFMESDQQRHSTEMARLRGARLVTVDETDSSKRWNEKRIKRITGGGKIEARFMRQDDFEFVPQFKLLIAGNHKPQLRGVGKAIQRRIHLVPFTVTIHDEEKDEELPKKLEAEYPQILRWMIDGCLQWQRGGLKAPQQVLDATSRYIEGEDVIGEWIEERCDQSGEVQRPIAYKNYRAWVEGRGERPWSSKAFRSAIEERGFTERKSHGTWLIEGLSLRATAPDSEPEIPYYAQ